MKEKRHPDTGSSEIQNKMNPKGPTPRHMIIKMPKVKDKERILKVSRETQLVMYKRTPKRWPAYLSAEILQARRHWHNILKVLKRENSRNQEFPDKKEIKKFITAKLGLQDMFKGLKAKKKGY